MLASSQTSNRFSFLANCEDYWLIRACVTPTEQNPGVLCPILANSECAGEAVLTR